MKTPGPWRHTISTPSRGVQQWRDDASKGTTRIAWASEGGRGLAQWVIFLPVVPRDDSNGLRWVPPADLMTELERAPERLWSRARNTGYMLRRRLRDPSIRTGLRGDDDRDPGTPRSAIVADRLGHTWGAHHVVVLLVHAGLVELGTPDRIDAAATGVAQEVDAIKRFFFEQYDERLVNRGLVRLPPLRHRDDAGDETHDHAVVFALASCQYPAGLTDGPPNDHRGAAPATESLMRLAHRLMRPSRESLDAVPSLLLLVGDQVYVDATAGLFDARTQNDRLRLPYQGLMASAGAQSVFGLLPVATMLDDHELGDNWEPGVRVRDAQGNMTADRRATSRFLRDGVDAYRRFQRMAGPPLSGPPAIRRAKTRPFGMPAAGASVRRESALWSTFTHAGVPFFLADTRTERGVPPDGAPRRVDNWRRAQIMRRPQWDALCSFLLRHRDRVAFVASPAMLLPRVLGLKDEPSLALSCDGWDGYPASMHALLALICDHQLDRVVFLSGDAHVSMAVRATVTHGERRATFWSIHSSGLYCPYPFANDVIENYAGDETFTFRTLGPRGSGQEREYRCTVKLLKCVPGDGFALLAVKQTAPGRHTVRVCFDRAGGEQSCELGDIPASGASDIPASGASDIPASGASDRACTDAPTIEPPLPPTTWRRV